MYAQANDFFDQVKVIASAAMTPCCTDSSGISLPSERSFTRDNSFDVDSRSAPTVGTMTASSRAIVAAVWGSVGLCTRLCRRDHIMLVCCPELLRECIGNEETLGKGKLAPQDWHDGCLMWSHAAEWVASFLLKQMARHPVWRENLDQIRCEIVRLR